MALKILLADDSMTAQNMGKKILVDAGYDVIAVSNGAAAIKKVATEHPDLAILDVYMPGYTGLEVCERVKASIETSKIPVLLTVGKMEPFNPEDVNRVKADGVMIKPFEASDLIAAVQSIAQRLLAPAPPPRITDATLKLKGYEDTLRIQPPKVDHESTLRLTAEQVKAFQDASYKDWVSTTESPLDDMPTAAPEMPVTAAIPEPEPEAVPAIPNEAAEEPAMPAMQFDTGLGSRETPVFSAMSASGVASEHDIFAESTAPVAHVAEAYESPMAPTFYNPIVEPAEEASVFSITPPPPPPPPHVEDDVIPTMHEAEAPVEPIVSVEPEPAITAIVPEVPVLETSAPKTPGPMVVETAPELEPTISPAVEVAQVGAPGLEITSAPYEHTGFVAQEPELVTSSDDMSSFVTKFGVEGAEPVHVGMASDLSDEQLAAIITPLQEPAPEAYEVPMAAEAPVVEAATAEADAPGSVMNEVGAIEAGPIEASEPIVAYVPGFDDSQRLSPFKVEEEEPASEPVAMEAPVVPEVAEPSPGMEAAREVMAEPVAEPEPEMKAEVVPEPMPEPVMEAVAAHEETVVTPSVAEAAHQIEPSSVVHAIEAAVAAAAGTAVAAGIAHVVHAEPERVEDPIAHAVEAPAEVQASAPAEEPAEMRREPMGDAALAEELAAALTTKETEDHARAVADHAAAPEFEAGSAATEHGMQGITDHKLAEAVARAFENLKPQLITEIIKELMR